MSNENIVVPETRGAVCICFWDDGSVQRYPVTAWIYDDLMGDKCSLDYYWPTPLIPHFLANVWCVELYEAGIPYLWIFEEEKHFNRLEDALQFGLLSAREHKARLDEYKQSQPTERARSIPIAYGRPRSRAQQDD